MGVIVSIFVFNPLAAHNFFLGMSGVAWIGANLFVVLASVVFWISAERGRPYGYLLAVALAIAASQFYSTGIAAICVLGIQGICSRSTRRIGVAIFLLGVFYLILFWFFQRVPEHHAPRNFDPVAIMRFCFTFIGGAIAKTEQSAIVLGAVGCGLGGVVVLGNLIFPRKRELKTAFWIALMAYASVAAGFAAIGRSNMGGDAAALASRYATVPALFWIGILGSLLEVLRERPFGRRIVLGIFVVAAMLIVWNGRSRVAYLMQRSAGKDLATLALSMGVKDPEIMKYVTPVANQYYRIEEELKRFRHVPFNGRTFGCPELGSRLEAPADPTRIAGFLDAVSPTADPHWARVVGWAADAREAQPLGTSGPGGGYGCVALLDSDGVVVGLGIGGLQRPDVARYLGRSRSDYGWSGYIDTRAVARDTGSQSIYAAVSTPAGWVRLARPIELGPIESGLYR